jgi:hypothetical protein
VNIRDRQSVKDLYYIHRFIASSIAKLFGVSHVTILNIIHENKDVSIIPDTECLLCGLDVERTFYIDGDKENKNPQNIISLCEAHRRRLVHMQLRRRGGVLEDQF